MLNLKGITNGQSFRHSAIPGPKIQEIRSEGNDRDDMAQERGETVDDKYTFEAVKKAMAACYVYMAIINSKSNAWAKCKRAAER